MSLITYRVPVPLYKGFGAFRMFAYLNHKTRGGDIRKLHERGLLIIYFRILVVKCMAEDGMVGILQSSLDSDRGHMYTRTENNIYKGNEKFRSPNHQGGNMWIGGAQANRNLRG